jgi:hypothetical protein
LNGAVVGLRTIKNGKRVIGILLGMMVFVEGLFAIYIAKPTSTYSVGGIGQSMFGALLVIIGAVMVLVWALFRDKRMEGMPGKAVSIIMLLVSLSAIIEGIATGYLSSDIMIGSQGVSRKFIALAGVQLFIIGMLQLSLWMRRDEERHNWLLEWAGLVLTVVLLGEGLLLSCTSAEITLTDVGTISRTAVLLAGLQLTLLSGVLFVMQLFREKSMFTDRLGKKRTDVVFSIVALTIAAEALVMAYFAGSVTLSYPDSSNPDGFGKLVVSLVAAQLFAVGLLVFSVWRTAKERLDRQSLVEFLGTGAGIVIAAEGAFALGISGRTKVTGIGGVKATTFMMAGLGLMVLGLLVLFVWQSRNYQIVKRIAGKGRPDLLILVVGLIIGLGGVAVSALSAKVNIDEIGIISARYIELSGVQLILLASIMVLTWGLRVDGISQRMKRVSYMAALFLMLLIPPAILM